MPRPVHALLLLFVLYGCDDDEGGASDATGDGGGSDTASDVAADSGQDAAADGADAADVADAIADGDPLIDTGADSDSNTDTPDEDVAPGTPPTPANTSIARGDRQLGLSWDADPNADDFVVGRALVSGGPYTDLAPTTATSFTDTGLINRQTYYYVVRARNDLGESAPSAELSEAPYAEGRALCLIGGRTAVRSPADAGEATATWGERIPYLEQYWGLDIDTTAGEILTVAEVIGGIAGFPRESDGVVGASRFVALAGDGSVPVPQNVLDLAIDPVDRRLWLAAETGVYALAPGNGGGPTLQHIPVPAAAVAVDEEHDAILVVSGDQLLTFGRDADGESEPSRTLNLPGPAVVGADLAYDPAHDEIWVLHRTAQSILAYAHDATGDTAPLRTMVVAGEGEAVAFRGLAYDESRSQVLVSIIDDTEGEVRAFDRDDTGTPEPARAIALAVYADSMAYDAERDEIVVLDATPRLATFAGDADGDATPLRTIQNAEDSALSAAAVAYHAGANEIWLATGLALQALDASGEAADPVRTIAGEDTLLGTTQGLTIDDEHDEIWVGSDDGTLLAFATTASGDVEPLRAITEAEGAIAGPYGLVYDPDNDLVVVTSSESDSHRVLAFARDADGPTAPEHVLSGTLDGPDGLALDTVRDELFVANWNGNSVQVYAWPADGDSEPLREILLPERLAPFAWPIAVDPVNREVLVGDGRGTDFFFALVYDLEADGDAAPLRTLYPWDVGLGFVAGMAFCDGLE